MNKNARAARGPEIRAARESLGLTQVELADEAQVHPRTLRNIETGHTVGQPDVIDRLGAAITRLSRSRRRDALKELGAIQGRFSDRADQYYDDGEALNTALMALVEMQTNLLRGDLEAVKANSADFFLPTFFILSDLASKAGSRPLEWVPAIGKDEAPGGSDIEVKPDLFYVHAVPDDDSVEGPPPPMDAAAFDTGQPSAKERMMREQDEDAERQD